MMPTLPMSLAALCAAAFASEGAWGGREVITREAWAMGTRVQLVAEAPTRAAAERRTEAALREIERLEQALSTWVPASQLSALNRARPGERVTLTQELAGLLAEVEAWARRTGRAFDPTVGALMDAWGVRAAPRTPEPAEIERALRATGPHVLVVAGRHGSWGAVGGWIDSGGFGKGAALRAIARKVPTADGDRLLVDLGGQLWAGAPASSPWPVDVAHPRERRRSVARLEVHGVSVATSGSSERPGHLLDPRSGFPAPAWGSVTVVHEDALVADVLSTALYVMGPEAGLAWARAEGVAALFVSEDGEGLGLVWTEEMEEWLVQIQPTTAPTTSREGTS